MVKKYYFAKNILIRREHFGTLILLRNGERYIVDNVNFNLLKDIYNQKNINIENKKINFFLKDLLSKNIIVTNKSKSGNLKLIENRFISYDCLSFPRTVYWECTNRCNYKCIHCYSSSGESFHQEELKFNTVKKMIDEMSVFGAEFLSIGGGEPLLYKDIFNVIKYAAKKGIEVELTTNASLITEETIQKLVNSGLKFIQVSLDGANENTYSLIRKGGDFNEIIKIIPKISKNFILSICSVINKLNYNKIDDLIEISKKVNAKHFRVIPLMEIGRGINIKSLQLSKKQLKELHAIIQHRKKREKLINIQLNENLVLPENKNISWMPENHFGCSAARTTCGIDFKGNVYPCSFMEFDELKCGNIKNSSLLKIWENSKVMKNLRNLDKLSGKCLKCRYLNLCRGGCRAAAYMKNKRLTDSDYLCSVI